MPKLSADSNKLTSTAEFILAVEEGNVDKVKSLNFSEDHLHVRISHSYPPSATHLHKLKVKNCNFLHITTANNFFDLTVFLLNQADDKLALINAQDDNGCTPLHIAVQYNSIDIMKCLLKMGANVELKQYDGYTALHWTIFYENPEVIKLLITYGANVNTKNKKNESPLHSILIHHSSVYVTLGSKAEKIVELLLEAGTDTEATYTVEKTSSSIMVDKSVNTPLYGAVRRKLVNVVKLLLKAGASTENQGSYGFTPLMYITMDSSESGDEYCEADSQIVKLLLEANANVVFRYPINGNTPLHCMMLFANYYYATTHQILRMLIHAGADTSMRNKYGVTPIDLAKQNRNYKVILEEITVYQKEYAAIGMTYFLLLIARTILLPKGKGFFAYLPLDIIFHIFNFIDDRLAFTLKQKQEIYKFGGDKTTLGKYHQREFFELVKVPALIFKTPRKNKKISRKSDLETTQQGISRHVRCNLS